MSAQRKNKSASANEKIMSSICEVSTFFADIDRIITGAKTALGLTDFAVRKEDIQEAEILFLLADYNPESRTAEIESARMEQSLTAKMLRMDSNQSRIQWGQRRELFLKRGSAQWLNYFLSVRNFIR